MTELRANRIVGALQFAGSHGLDDAEVNEALNQLESLLAGEHLASPSVAPRHYLTEVGSLLDGSPVVVGWDHCGKCRGHIANCDCKDGPIEPAYITRLRDPKQREARFAAGLPTAVRTPEKPELGSQKIQDSLSTEKPIAHSASIAAGLMEPKWTGKTCANCDRPVVCDGGASDTADANDDGGFICFTCQEAS